MLEGMMNESATESSPVKVEENDSTRRKMFPEIPQFRHSQLLTFEVGESLLLWTAIPKKRRSGEMLKGAVDLGYGDPDGLVSWFQHFRARIGDSDHEIGLAVSGPEIIERCFMVPVVPKAELPAVIRTNAKSILPFDIDKGLHGFKIVEKVEWAGGLKYEVFLQSLGEQWNDWLPRMFGDILDRVTTVTSCGQMIESLLRETADGFCNVDAYVIRIKSDLLETALFHKGHLEFFREVTIDSLAERQYVSSLKKLLEQDEPEDGQNEESMERVVADVRTLIGDALDYYHGQFGQRKISAVYISVPLALVEPIVAHVTRSISDNVIDLNDESRIAVHSKKAGVSIDTGDYSQWMSVIPIRKMKASVVNILPHDIRERRISKYVSRYGLISLIFLIAILTSLSAVKAFSNRALRQSVEENKLIAGEAGADPVLEALSNFEAKASSLDEYASIARSDRSLPIKTVLVVLSQIAHEDVKLNRLVLAPDDQLGLEVTVSGEVMGPLDRQEVEFYAFITALEKHPLVKSMELKSKSTQSKSVDATLHFSLELVVGK
jgi:hypothetical protein